MAEQRVDADVPELDVMSAQEIWRRLRATEEEIALVCRACNRQVSRSSEAPAHDCGQQHEDVVDARTHRLTHLNLGMPFDEKTWCNVCGQKSPNVEAFHEHLCGKRHRECLRVENRVWALMRVARSLREELARRGLVAASSGPAGPEAKASVNGAMAVSQVDAGTVAGPCLPGFVRASSAPTGTSVALGVVDDWVQPTLVGCPTTQAEAAADAAAAAASAGGRNSPIPGDASDDEDDDLGVVAVADVEERLEDIESSVAGLVGGVLDVGRDIRAMGSDQKEVKQVISQLSTLVAGLVEEQKSLYELLSGIPGELVALTEAVERPVSLQFRRGA